MLDIAVQRAKRRTERDEEGATLLTRRGLGVVRVCCGCSATQARPERGEKKRVIGNLGGRLSSMNQNMSRRSALRKVTGGTVAFAAAAQLSERLRAAESAAGG